jgi:NAD(P)H-hydrate epimerase
MRNVDRIAVEEVGLGLLQMMENAGRGLARQVRACGSGPVVVLAGNGGNGGGGMAAARHLSNRDVEVSVVLDRDPSSLDGGAAAQHRTLSNGDVPVSTDLRALEDLPRDAIVVDALVGYGLDGEVREPVRTYIEQVDELEGTVLSLDVPSGTDATTGEVLGCAVRPDRTVTLALPKTGLRDLDSSLVLVDIGIPRSVYERARIDYANPFDEEDWVELV